MAVGEVMHEVFYMPLAFHTYTHGCVKPRRLSQYLTDSHWFLPGLKISLYLKKQLPS